MRNTSNNRPKRKYAWMDEFIKQTGRVAMDEARENNTYIVYEKDGNMVKEYPDGRILPLSDEQ